LIIFWDIEKKVPIKHVNLNEVAAKYIQGKLLCPPLIYSVHGNDQTLLASCETGHVFCLNLKEPKKVKNLIFVILKKNYLDSQNISLMAI
jgi:hypothetical protein